MDERWQRKRELAARNGYRIPFPPNVATAEAVDQAIRRLAPGKTHAEVAATIFAGRTNGAMVRFWRRAHRSVPQWALDMLQGHLEPYQAIARKLATVPAGRGQNWGRGESLGAWRLEQARKRAAQDP